MSAPTFAHGQMRLYLLSLLTDSPKHGYELMQGIEQRFNGTYVPSAGTIYPRLAKLAEDGLATRRVEGRKTMYAITSAGKAELAQRADELQSLERDIDASLADGTASDDAHAEADDLRDSIRRSMSSLRTSLERPGSRSAEFSFPAYGHNADHNAGAQMNDAESIGLDRSIALDRTHDGTRTTQPNAASSNAAPSNASPASAVASAAPDNGSPSGNGSPVASAAPADVSEADRRYDSAMAVIDEFRDSARAMLEQARSGDRISGASLEVLGISLKRALEDLNRTL